MKRWILVREVLLEDYQEEVWLYSNQSYKNKRRVSKYGGNTGEIAVVPIQFL